MQPPKPRLGRGKKGHDQVTPRDPIRPKNQKSNLLSRPTSRHLHNQDSDRLGPARPGPVAMPK